MITAARWLSYRPSVIASGALNVDKALLVRYSGSSCTMRRLCGRRGTLEPKARGLPRNLYGYQVRALSTLKPLHLSSIWRLGSLVYRRKGGFGLSDIVADEQRQAIRPSFDIELSWLLK